MGARRRGRSSVVVDGREFLWNVDDQRGLRIVSADKRVAVTFEDEWPEQGRPNVRVVTGPEFAALPAGPRPARVVLPRSEHCYSLKGWVRRVAEWAMSTADVRAVPATGDG